MPGIRDVEDAVRRLSEADLKAFRAWFAAYDSAEWDRQLERDAASGRLDAAADEALAELARGACTDL